MLDPLIAFVFDAFSAGVALFTVLLVVGAWRAHRVDDDETAGILIATAGLTGWGAIVLFGLSA